jgi:hypothetical protein
MNDLRALDAILVVSNEISSYMNTSVTTQSAELVHAIQALPEKEQLRVQMKTESDLNEIVSEMISSERKAYLKRWNELRETNLIKFTIHDGQHEQEKYAIGAQNAARVLWNFCQESPVWMVDWLPEKYLKLAPILNLSNWRPYNYAFWPDVERQLGMKDCQHLPVESIITDTQLDKLRGPQIEKPSLHTCLEWIQKAPLVILNGNFSVCIENVNTCDRLV